MTQVLTLSCKIDVPIDLRPRVDATLIAFSEACNTVRKVAEASGTTNKVKLHHMMYREIRTKYGLSSNLAIRAIYRVAGALKAKRRHSVFHPTSADYDQRIFRLREKDCSVTLTLLGGAVRFKLMIGARQRNLLTGRRPTSATLVKRKNGTYFIQIALKSEPPMHTEPAGVLGVDLGIKNLATLSTGERFGGADVESFRNHYQALRTSLQRKGTKGAKRLLKRLSGREKRYMAWVNHTMSARIIRFARHHGLAVAIEDLTGIRYNARVRKSQRSKLHRWAFYQLRRFLEYKSIRDGVILSTVTAAYTSKTCHRCLRIGNRDRDSFTCNHCGYSGHADYNAACNISSLGECVTLPEHSLYCDIA